MTAWRECRLYVAMLVVGILMSQNAAQTTRARCSGENNRKVAGFEA
jgi:hypothetical protein